MFYEGVKMYNALSNEIREREAMWKTGQFKRMLKEYILINVN